MSLAGSLGIRTRADITLVGAIGIRRQGVDLAPVAAVGCASPTRGNTPVRASWCTGCPSESLGAVVRWDWHREYGVVIFGNRPSHGGPKCCHEEENAEHSEHKVVLHYRCVVD